MKEISAILMQEFPAVVYIFVFLFGLCVGSFLNVCIYRIPEKQSIVVVPSHCMTCGKKLHWYELIPLFSWLALRGKCHGCKSKISPQYPLIETLNALLWVLVLFVKGLSWDMLLTCALISALVVIAMIDFRTMEIPNGLVIFCLVLAVIRTVLGIFYYKTGWLDPLLGLVVLGGIFFLILFVSGGAALGGGDVKLMIAVGLFLGLKAGIFGVFAACAVGSIIHLLRMKFQHVGRELAFGPYLSLGYAIAALWGKEFMTWYLARFFG